MASLGDIFPDDWKESLANENLKPGAVIRIAVPDTTPPKIKFLLVVSIDGDKISIASLFINTDINPNVFNTPVLQSLQYLVKQDKNHFMDHNSYADCSKITPRNYSDIFGLVKKEPSCHLGQINDEDFKNIRSLLKATKTIPVRLKKQFGLFV
jgi:hypothetical protein